MYFFTIRLCFTLFTVSGIHPEKGYRKFQILGVAGYLIFASILSFLVLYQFHDKVLPTFLEVLDAVSCMLLVVHSLIDETCMFFKKNEIVELLETMRGHFWTIEAIKDSKLKELYVRYHNILRYKCLFYISIYLSTVVSFFIGPILSEGEVLSYECYRLPWISYYQLLCLVNFCGMYSTLFTIIPVDMLFMSIITLTTVQFVMLNAELQNVIQDDSEDKDVDRRIRRCLRHHCFLLNYMRQINEAFSIRMVLFFGIILITMCLEMYRSTCPDSDWKTFAESILYTTSGLYEFLSCYCFPVQFLINQADKVAELMYQTKWYKSKCRAQSASLMILLAQKRVKIAAGGVVNIDFITGLNTVKTMISYCMFLKSIDID